MWPEFSGGGFFGGEGGFFGGGGMNRIKQMPIQPIRPYQMQRVPSGPAAGAQRIGGPFGQFLDMVEGVRPMSRPQGQPYRPTPGPVLQQLQSGVPMPRPRPGGAPQESAGGGGGPYGGAPGGPPVGLPVTPQEQFLYNRHLNNLTGPGGVTNPDGSRSTVRQMTFGIGDKTYNLPTVWDGQILAPNDALNRAKQIGLDRFPSYKNKREAQTRYNQMHSLMERDLTGAPQQTPTGVAEGVRSGILPFGESPTTQELTSRGLGTNPFAIYGSTTSPPSGMGYGGGRTTPATADPYAQWKARRPPYTQPTPFGVVPSGPHAGAPRIGGPIGHILDVIEGVGPQPRFGGGFGGGTTIAPKGGAPVSFPPQPSPPSIGQAVKGVGKLWESTVGSAFQKVAELTGLSPGHVAAIGSIESAFDPGSNRNRPTQYKGLFQIGRSEWKEAARAGMTGSGDIYNPHDNAMAMAYLVNRNKEQFKTKFGRDPTPGELYLMHQQGLGFYTRGAMTNIGGNLPRGAPSDARTHAGFEKFWTGQLERRAQRLSPQEAKKIQDRFSEVADLTPGL